MFPNAVGLEQRFAQDAPTLAFLSPQDGLCSITREHDIRSGFPGGTRDKVPSCPCRRCKRHGFDPCIGKIP